MAETIGRVLPKVLDKILEKTFRKTTVPTGALIGVGGTVTQDGEYAVHTFLTDETFEIIEGEGEVEYLIVAGGGAGGGVNGSGVATGGGGGGGVLTGTDAMTVGSFPVVIGAGGAGTNDTGTNGGNSTFNGHLASGGGGGGSIANSRGGNLGGSGGGAGSQGAVGTFDYLGGLGEFGQGFGGGDGTHSGAGGGGGGGASEMGANGTAASGGDGGDGISSDITGAAVVYGGGGGGCIPVDAFGPIAGTPGAGGAGGGAAGRSTAGIGNSGTSGRGGGGGGTTGAFVGGAGGSGVVIVRYRGTGQGGTGTWSGPITAASQTIDGVDVDVLDYVAGAEADEMTSDAPDRLYVTLQFTFSEPVVGFRLTSHKPTGDTTETGLIAAEDAGGYADIVAVVNSIPQPNPYTTTLLHPAGFTTIWVHLKDSAAVKTGYFSNVQFLRA